MLQAHHISRFARISPRRLICAAAIITAMLLPLRSRAKGTFFRTGQPEHFMQFQAHALMGTSVMLQNYASTFPALTSLQVSPGFSAGIGAKVGMNIRQWFSIATEINATVSNTSLSAVVNPDSDKSTPMGAILARNTFYELNIPVYATVTFYIADNVRWNLDLGFYYSAGLGGRQRQWVSTSYINDLGQLINLTQYIKTGYFNDTQTFLNSASTADWGLHLATSFDLGRHVNVGFRAQTGLRNVAHDTSAGTAHPRVNNFSALASLGWRF